MKLNPSDKPHEELLSRNTPVLDINENTAGTQITEYRSNVLARLEKSATSKKLAKAIRHKKRYKRASILLGVLLLAMATYHFLMI